MAHGLFNNSNIIKVLIGVVHLPPLPGSPGWGGDMAWVLNRAQEEASVLEQGGANGIIVENFRPSGTRHGRGDDTGRGAGQAGNGPPCRREHAA